MIEGLCWRVSKELTQGGRFRGFRRASKFQGAVTWKMSDCVAESVVTYLLFRQLQPKLKLP